MTPDRRLYFTIYNHENTTADQEIFDNTKLLIDKSRRKNPNTIVDEIRYAVDRNFINTTWYFLNNSLAKQTNCLTEIRKKLKSLTVHSELVLRGHGDVKGRKLSRISPEVLARGLLALGLSESCRINITGCSLGRNAHSGNGIPADNAVNAVSGDSFADVFVRTLVKEGGLTPAVHARTNIVTVAGDGSKETRRFNGEKGEYEHQQHNSKVIWRVFDNGTIVRMFAY